jgi:ligand-binding sensor domain-containing protein
MSTFVIDEIGQLLTTGFYSAREGLIDMGDHERFTPITNDILPNNVKIKVVAKAFYHVLLLDDNDIVWAYGKNDCGQLGFFNMSRLNCFRHINQLPPIKHISTAHRHSLALDYNGKVWISGYTGSKGENIYSFSVIRNIPEIQYINASGRTSLLISTDGDVLISKNTGIYTFTTLNHDNYILTEQDRIPIILYGYLGGIWGDKSIILIDTNGHIWEKFEYKPLYRQNIKLPPIKTLSIGLDNIILLDYDGNIWVRGSNDYGQLGIDSIKPYIKSFTKVDNIPYITSVYCGYRFSMLLDIENTIWVCGESHLGQLGLVDNPNEEDFYGISGLFNDNAIHNTDNSQNMDERSILIRKFIPVPYIKCSCLMNSDPVVYPRIKSTGSLL